MRVILDWISKYSHWLVLILLESISLVLLFSFNSYQCSLWFTGANRVVGQVNDWEQQAVSYISLGERNEELTRSNIELQERIDKLRRALYIAQHDSSVTERLVAENVRGVEMIPAHITSNTIMHRDNYMTIDKGTVDGVQKEMGVMCGTGIVGIVSQAGRHHSIVIPILNSRSRISCRLRGSEFFGYLTWRGGSPLVGWLEDIPRHARFKVGDAVETSGFSNVFPEGIFVGRVMKICDSRDGLSFELAVQLSVDLAHVRYVEVIKGSKSSKGSRR